jgi:hypothetical protein
MSLAMYAAPFDDKNTSVSNDDNYINKKKQTHNKTQKMFPKESFTTNSSFNSKKVNSVLEHLHNTSTLDEDDEDESLPFSPPPPPQSSGVERKKITENYKLLGNTPQPVSTENNLELNNYQSNYHNKSSLDDYYKKMLPEYFSQKHPSYSMDTNSSQDILIQKLNYMIHLLEEQQDEKTNNVTEEVVLYSFLGIFIIFIADSFVRIGKYVR